VCRSATLTDGGGIIAAMFNPTSFVTQFVAFLLALIVYFELIA
jgi:hypothetical protein